MTKADRVAELQRKLEASTTNTGKPMLGYAKRSQAIRDEIARLMAPAATPTEPT